MYDLSFAPLWLTLRVASVATFCTFIIGVLLAFALARGKFWGKDWLDALLSLPLVLPPTVLGYYLIVLFGRHGWLGQWLDATFGISLIFTWQGAAVACTIVSLPMVFKSARTAFEGADQNLEHAARTLGLSELAIFCESRFHWPGVEFWPERCWPLRGPWGNSAQAS